MKRVLVIEPDAEQRMSIVRCLEEKGYSASGHADLALIDAQTLASVQAVLARPELPSGSALDLLVQLDGIPLVLMAEAGSIREAVAAIRRGATDYLSGSLDPQQLIAAIETAGATPSGPDSAPAPSAAPPDHHMLGSCASMQNLVDRIRKVAPTESTVLIQGESGTGKELVARAIHGNSLRVHAPMISLNCAAIPESLIESELFGHERGAFTGANATRNGLIEAAHGGTLFLDEIGELPLEAQARLLRVLQEGEIRRVGATATRTVDVRLIAATHRDLRKLTEIGHFREDLYYRLNVVTMDVPPLRDRGDDVLEMAETMLQRTGTKFNKPNLTLAEDTRQAMCSYHWPGNVRELENAIERAVILCEGHSISPELLAIDHPVRTAESEVDTGESGAPTSLEGYFVKFVLEHQDQLTETELAKKLGISRKSLWERRQRLNIPRKRTRQRRPRRSTDV